MPIQQTSAASGKEMCNPYCAPCHGVDGEGDGSATAAIKSAPIDLTQWTQKHEGKYPAASPSGILKFGSGPDSHGSADMPVCGPLLRSLDKYHDTVEQQRVGHLVNYLEMLQVK
jgi:hypothetical protein